MNFRKSISVKRKSRTSESEEPMSFEEQSVDSQSESNLDLFNVFLSNSPTVQSVEELAEQIPVANKEPEAEKQNLFTDQNNNNIELGKNINISNSINFS